MVEKVAGPDTSFDEEVRARQKRAQGRGQSPRSTRVTGGNANNASLIDKLRGARGKVRGAARAAGSVTGAAAAEGAGLASEFTKGAAEGAGLTEKAKAAAKQGTSRAGEGLNAAKDAAKKVPGAAKKFVGKAALGAGKLAIPGIGAAFLAGEAQKSTEQLQSQAGGQRIDPLRGAPGAGPANLERTGFGFDARPPSASELARGPLGIPGALLSRVQIPDSVLAAGQAGLGAIRGAFDPTADTSPVAPPAGAPETAQTPAETTQATPGQGTGTQGQGGARSAFTGGGAEIPQSGTGFFVNSKGERTNLGTPQAAAPGQGLRAAAPAQTQNEELTQTLADQARGGGLSSAFGAIASGGNVLREQAANRQRQFQTQEAEQTQQNKIDIELTKAAAKAGPDREKAFNEQSRTRLDALAAAEGADDGGVSLNREKDNLAANALRDINGADAAIFSGLVSEELTAFAENSGFLDLLGLGPGRNLFEKLSESDAPVVTLNPENGVFFDRAKGAIFKRSETEGEDPQRIVDLDGLPKRTQDFLRAKGIILGKNKKGEQGLRRGGAASSGRIAPQLGLGQ